MFHAVDGIRDFCVSRGLGDVYRREVCVCVCVCGLWGVWSTGLRCVCSRCGRAVAVGDVAMVIGSADPVEVWFHVAADGICYTCISPWSVTGAHARHKAARISMAPRFVKSAMLADSVVYYRGATECTVLVPPHLR